MLRSQRYTALLCALAGLVFGLLESTIYVLVYFPEGSAAFVAYRYTVNPLLHAVFSYVFGQGINERLKASAWGETPFMSGNKRFFVWAIVLHATYNLLVSAFPLFE